jgi:hypothetical protein
MVKDVILRIILAACIFKSNLIGSDPIVCCQEFESQNPLTLKLAYGNLVVKAEEETTKIQIKCNFPFPRDEQSARQILKDFSRLEPMLDLTSDGKITVSMPRATKLNLLLTGSAVADLFGHFDDLSIVNSDQGSAVLFGTVDKLSVNASGTSFTGIKKVTRSIIYNASDRGEILVEENAPGIFIRYHLFEIGSQGNTNGMHALGSFHSRIGGNRELLSARIESLSKRNNNIPTAPAVITSIPLTHDPLNTQQKERLENKRTTYPAFANRDYFVIGACVALGLFCIKKSLAK